MAVSPYKRFKSANSQWAGYISMDRLTPHKGYKILAINPTNHKDFGPGEQATVEEASGRRWRVQLPGKYLRHPASAEMIEGLKADIAKEQYPFLVFREKMLDKSFRMDIVATSPDYVNKFGMKEDFDELEDSVDNIDDNVNPNGEEGGNGGNPNGANGGEENGGNAEGGQ